jgi:hypothetical protein
MFVVDAAVEVVEGDVSVSVDVYETVTLRFVVAVFDNNHIGTHRTMPLPWRWCPSFEVVEVKIVVHCASNNNYR